MDIDVNIIEDNIRLRPFGREIERLLFDNKKLLSLTSWKPSCDFMAELI